MIEVYTIFSAIKDDVSFTDGKIYFFPSLNGSISFGGYMSALTPIIFVKKDY